LNADLILAQRVRPVAEAVEWLGRRLDDTLIAATSRCWNAAEEDGRQRYRGNARAVGGGERRRVGE